MYDGVDVSQVQMNPSSYSDQKARMFVKENFPKSVVIDDSQKVGNTGPNADTVGVDNNFEDEESRKVLHESIHGKQKLVCEMCSKDMDQWA